MHTVHAGVKKAMFIIFFKFFPHFSLLMTFSPILFSFQLPVCYARPIYIYIYIIHVPTRNRNNEFIL